MAGLDSAVIYADRISCRSENAELTRDPNYNSACAYVPRMPVWSSELRRADPSYSLWYGVAITPAGDSQGQGWCSAGEDWHRGRPGL